ncbi:hypothetical protein GT037_005771 [Alternaria burnsii]|uniref:Uncharacterized protein n=1 Tax=Alternaria burnsii TaxID=1187904 RepID=A0A8H7EHT6_9PLEO|nr:uncharacterized protein GT037_005771 [Alternaria burnsii]KAF7676266.1 hypothetical protein GT037_005771 [Alternaria burnsii]
MHHEGGLTKNGRGSGASQLHQREQPVFVPSHSLYTLLLALFLSASPLPPLAPGSLVLITAVRCIALSLSPVTRHTPTTQKRRTVLFFRSTTQTEPDSVAHCFLTWGC